MALSAGSAGPPTRPARARPTERLRLRILALLLLVSLTPLAGLGGGAWVVFGDMAEQRAMEVQRGLARTQATAIDLYLSEQVRTLRLAGRTLSFERAAKREALTAMFDSLRASHGDTFADIGVIDDTGMHVSYVGPYPLDGKDYSSAPWFLEVMEKGSHISDVFMGYRQVPHWVVAVRRNEGSKTWVLRATMNSTQFEGLVHGDRFGIGADTFLVNRDGLAQTPFKAGRVLDRALPPPQPHEGLHDALVKSNGKHVFQVTSWVNGGRWMLVVEQEERAVKAPVHRALGRGALVALAAATLLVATTMFATRYLTSAIDKANERREQLSRDLIRSAKLASVGELATGLAHEINNPLAIIGSEGTNIGDILEMVELPQTGREELQESVQRIQRQVERCSSITSKMLQFGRQGESDPQVTNIAPRLRDVLQLLQRQARVGNVELELHIDPTLPRVVVDPVELDQVLINLITNSLQAMQGGGRIRVTAVRSHDEVSLTVEDNGSGIPKENLDRIFQPFFTTKPPGKGTGLGLSVCYGIVRGWGGSLRAASEPGQGTTMTIRLPIPRDERPSSAPGPR